MKRQKLEIAANSTTSAQRVVGRPFAPGVSGNPSGRPRGLVRSIRQETDDGTAIVALMVRVLRGQRVRLGDRVQWPTLQERIEAASWLANHAYGKPSSEFDMAVLEALSGRSKK
jgi:hypothetical protein